MFFFFNSIAINLILFSIKTVNIICRTEVPIQPFKVIVSAVGELLIFNIVCTNSRCWLDVEDLFRTFSLCKLSAFLCIGYIFSCFIEIARGNTF